MLFERKFRKTTELGIAIVTISALVLVGCGGGRATITPSVVSEVCPATGNVTGTAAVTCLLAEMTVPAGARVNWGASPATSSPVNGAPIFPWVEISKIVASSSVADAYTFSLTYKEAMSGLGWTERIPSFTEYWNLSPNGWVSASAVPTVETLTNNNDTLLVISPISGYSLSAISKTDLSGKTIVCNNNPIIDEIASSVPCANPASFPTGAAAYKMVRTELSDSYFVSLTSGLPLYIFGTTTPSTPLVQLPQKGDKFCISMDPTSFSADVFEPIVPTPPAGADNYNFYSGAYLSTMGCSVSAVGGVPTATTQVTIKNVHGVDILEWNASGAKNIVAFNGVELMKGERWRTAGVTYTRNYVNKSAANAQLGAHGILNAVNNINPLP